VFLSIKHYFIAQNTQNTKKYKIEELNQFSSLSRT